MKTYTEAELRDIVKKHGAWLRGEKDGVRAYLAGANLARANLARANLARANLEGAYLAGAYLAGANLARANLARANLEGAYLAGANLARANLARANLEGAYLARANLARANLARAKGIPPERTTPLLILQEQVGKIRAYKLVTSTYQSPIRTGTPLTYELGAILEVKNANTDPLVQCAEGISLCTLDWCLRAWTPGYRVMVCEFSAKDIACIPTATDGKFRVTKCKVIKEKDISGLVGA